MYHKALLHFVCLCVCPRACLCNMCKSYGYSKTCVKRPISKRPKIGFLDQYRLLHVKSITECCLFRPSFSYHLSLRSLFLSIFEWPFYTGFTVFTCVSDLLRVLFGYNAYKESRPVHEISNNVVCATSKSLRSACAYAQSDQSLC